MHQLRRTHGYSGALAAIAATAACLALPTVAAEQPPADVVFNRDIRPLLAEKCLACHGRDEEHREADLRLDERDVAIDHEAIVPGKPDESEMIRRIESADPDERMPPPDSGMTLSADEVRLLRKWVAAGAEYQRHWAFIHPMKPPLPHVKNSAWTRNEIDHFVLSRLEEIEMEPAQPADRYTLVRRVYLDLIGVPPTPEQADEFVRNDDPRAYEDLVDQLLASELYGEHWGRRWLDLARYADTNGYEKDRERSIWPYRDWVIKALNDDMPYDQFTIHQLAGDMLADADPSANVATGFHRNTMLNEEGGIDPLEYRFYAMVDRVATTGTVWLGLTTGCAQCHTHKYDPITHTDYYRFMALMNNADEPDRILRSEEVTRRREDILAQIADLEAGLPAKFPVDAEDGEEEPTVMSRQQAFDAAFQSWLQMAQEEAVAWRTLPLEIWKTNLPKLEVMDDGSIFSSGDITKRDVFELGFAIEEGALPVTALRLEVLPDDRLPKRGPGRAFYEGRKGDFFLSELTAKFRGADVEFVEPSRSYGKIAIGSGDAEAKNVLDGNGSTGWSTAEREGEAHQLVLNLKEPIRERGKFAITLLFERHFAASLGRFRFSTGHSDRIAKAKQIPIELERILSQPRDQWGESVEAELRQHFARTAPQLAEARKPIEALRRQLPEYPTTMVLQERPQDNPRKTYRHHRGEFLSPREEVQPGLPGLFAEDNNPPRDRLSLARWLVSEQNPLAARVAVNRAWQAFFGTGLVRTPGDFGTQSEPPTHPLLLDWLACQWMEDGWSMKGLHRRIVLSATYRQDARVPADKRRRDPQNRFLARGPRFRVSAEVVRDSLLKSSGLLSEKMFGKSVFPPQPAGVTALAYGNFRWRESKGEDRYRRSLYTFSKRTAPFAAYTVFDGPTGENCVVKRDRSNTPLQALTLLNDPMYLEMARALADRCWQPNRSDTEVATSMFRALLIRPPTEKELEAIIAYRKHQETRLLQGELDARAVWHADVSGDGAQKGSKDRSAADDVLCQRASWAMVARSLMNLDEVVTKP